jgi:hypothetical protein
MWTILKTILFGLLDLFLVGIIVRWLFKYSMQFFKALWQAGMGSFLTTITKDNTNDPISGYKVFLVFIVLGMLLWGERTLFF